MTIPTTPAREWPGLTERDQNRLTTWKSVYVLTHQAGFSVTEAQRLCFTRWRRVQGAFAADQGAADAPHHAEP